MICKDSDGHQYRIELVLFGGHLLMPIDDFAHHLTGAPMPSYEAFVEDPLGVRTWFGSTEEHEPLPCEAEYSCEPEPVTSSQPVVSTALRVE